MKKVNRTEYIITFFTVTILAIAGFIVADIVEGSTPMFLLTMLFVFGFGVYHIVVIMRRLEDIGISCNWIILYFIPVIGILFCMYLMIKKGKEYPRKETDNQETRRNEVYKRFYNELT